jgi:hypothetical protein
MHNPMTVVVWDRAMMDRVMHDNHAMRLRHRQCRQRQGRNGQRNGSHKLLHGTPLLVGERAKHAKSMLNWRPYAHGPRHASLVAVWARTHRRTGVHWLHLAPRKGL